MKKLTILFAVCCTLFILFYKCSEKTPSGPDVNIPPTVTAMNDTTAALNDSIYLHAHAYDEENSELLFIWLIDYLYVNDTTADSILKVSFPVRGQYTILVKVLDEKGAESEADTFNVTVFGFNPEVTLTSNGPVFSVNDTAYFVMHASDSDGIITHYLYSSNGVDFDTTLDSTFKIICSIDNSGIKTISAKVIDDDNLISETNSITVLVNLNAPVIQAMDDITVAVNDTVNLHVSAADSNGTVINILWSFDGINFDTTADTTYKKLWAVDDFGIKTVSVKAIDNDSVASKTDSVIVTVLLHAPSVNAMDDTTIAVNDSITLHATATDINGTVEKYLWAFLSVESTFDTTTDSVYKAFWPVDDPGIKTAAVKVLDDDGIVSNHDYITITVKLYAPVVSAVNDLGIVNDTIIPVNDSLLVTISAVDSNGIIQKYYWDFGADGWDDSTTNPDSVSRYITWPSGGNLPVVVGAKDDDGITGTDTINILFNRPPDSAGLKADYDTAKGGWIFYNYDAGSGGIQVSFLGTDPDEPYDTLRYMFYWGEDSSNLSLLYSDVNTILGIKNVDTLSTYYWRVVAKDLFGDSAFSTGSYNSPGPPPIGIFWNLVTNQANFLTDIDWHMAAFSHDGKMWLISETQDKNYVFNSTDGVVWSLVTDQADFHTDIDWHMAAFSHDGKMWLISDDENNKYVYNSTDGISWTLVTDQADFYTDIDWHMSAFSHDGKMWLISEEENVKNVYNSTDGISWTLVTDQANFFANPDWHMSAFSHDGKMWLIAEGLGNNVFRSGE